MACGDILEPDDDDFSEAGLALVQLLPVGDSGVQGFAVIERIALQRESRCHADPGSDGGLRSTCDNHVIRWSARTTQDHKEAAT